MKDINAEEYNELLNSDSPVVIDFPQHGVVHVSFKSNS